MSASALAWRSAISRSRRSRPSSSSASAWASASASRRARSASMSPRAWRICDRLGVGARRALRGVVELRLDARRAGRHGLLDERAGLPAQQREDDDRRQAAEEDLVALGPDPRVASGRWLVLLLGGDEHPVERASSADPHAHDVGDGAAHGGVIGAAAGGQLDGSGGDRDRRPPRRWPGRRSGPPRPRSRPRARRSSDRRVGLGDAVEALAVELRAGGVERDVASARTRGAAAPRTRRPRCGRRPASRRPARARSGPGRSGPPSPPSPSARGTGASRRGRRGTRRRPRAAP